MKMLSRSLAVLCLLGTAHLASAETITLALTNVTVDLPEGWTNKDVGNNTRSIDDAGKTVNIALIGTEGANLLGVVTNVTAMLKKMMPDMKLDKGKTAKVNGMVGKNFTGTGKYGPKPVKIGFLVLETPDHHGLIALSISEKAKLKASAKPLAKILASLKPPAAAAEAAPAPTP